MLVLLAPQILTKTNYSLCVLQSYVARVTDPHSQFIAHLGHRVLATAAAVTHGSSTSPAVVLAEAQLFLVHHSSDIPEEWSSTQLTSVALHPVRRLKQNNDCIVYNSPIKSIFESTLTNMLGVIHKLLNSKLLCFSPLHI